MTVTMADPVWEDSECVTMSWTSSLATPVYSVYRDGELIGTTTSESMRFFIAPGEFPMFEVLDDSSDPTYAAAGRIYLSWYSDPTANHYLVEEAPQGVYSTIATVLESGLGYQRYLTKWMSDGYDGKWRVTPVDAAGNSGTPLVFVVVQVRHPDVPRVSYSYSSVTGKVTILSVGDEGILDMAGERVVVSSTGSGAIAETIAAGVQKDFIETRLVLTDGPADMTGVVVSIGPTAALTTATQVYVPTVADATSASQLVNRFETPVLVDDDLTITVTWANATGKTWELQIIYTLI